MSVSTRTICTIAVTVAMLSACASPGPISLHRRNETLWASESAEYTAVALQTYEAARQKLDVAMDDPAWTACLEQEGDYGSLPPAVIVDLDETVLDNRPFQLRLIRENQPFDEQHWNEWVREGRADPIPGALEFLIYAHRRGVEIFYVTNRAHEVEEATRKNLAMLGLPLDPERDTLLSKHEQPDWTRDKTSRRRLISETHRVLLILGDDLDDFARSKSESRTSRHETVVSNRAMWGEKWFVFPNTLYGGWVAATLNGS